MPKNNRAPAIATLLPLDEKAEQAAYRDAIKRQIEAFEAGDSEKLQVAKEEAVDLLRAHLRRVMLKPTMH